MPNQILTLGALAGAPQPAYPKRRNMLPEEVRALWDQGSQGMQQTYPTSLLDLVTEGAGSFLDEADLAKYAPALALLGMVKSGKPTKVRTLSDLTEARPKAASLALFHGTNEPPFEHFDPARIGRATDEGLLGSGFYFSTDPNVARSSQTMIGADVNLKRPLHVAFPAWEANKTNLVNEAIGTSGLSGRTLTDKLRELGYDGVILDYSPVGYQHHEVLAFDPGQISITKASPLSEAERKKMFRSAQKQK